MKPGEINVGNHYSLTAIDADSRLFISHQEYLRDADTAERLFLDIEKRRDINTAIPAFTSDEWNAFKEGLIRVYSTVETLPYQGRGRYPKPHFIPYSNLMYAQVKKKRKRNRIVEVIQRVVIGDEEEVLKALGVDKDGVINTAYIERFNLTIRNSLARFVRNAMNFSKDIELHRCTIDFFQVWYNFVKPHKSLRRAIDHPLKKWEKRTPAMAANLTDHVWSLKEILTFRVPIQS